MKDVKRAVLIILARLLNVFVAVCFAAGVRAQRTAGKLLAYLEATR